MREVGGVQSRLDPSSYSICNTKCCGVCVSHLAEKESILATFRSFPLVYGLLAFAQVLNLATAGVMQRSCKQILFRIEAILLG
jgi:hypothetical protein